MAKRKSARQPGSRKASKKRPARAASGKRRRTVKPARRSAATSRRAAAARRPKKRATRPPAKAKPRARISRPRTAKKRPRLDRERRRLEETWPTPPSSLDMKRQGSAARSGRAALRDSLEKHHGMTTELTGGDVDADWENAYFSGEEAPGGDNPTPDQDVVDDIGKALGVEYQDNEELKASDKVTQRDKHRWELDPASSEDYKDRK